MSIPNSTSAQLGYTVPFTLIHAGKYRTKDGLKIQKLNTTQKKQTTQNTANQNYPGLVASYDTRPGNDVGLFYNDPGPTWGSNDRCHNVCVCVTMLMSCQTLTMTNFPLTRLSYRLSYYVMVETCTIQKCGLNITVSNTKVKYRRHNFPQYQQL